MNLYIDIDGVLLTTRNPKPAVNAAEFIRFITRNFSCFWLTTHCKGNAATAIHYLSNYFPSGQLRQLQSIQSTSWDTLKTEAIDFTTDFLWLDDQPFVAEEHVLQQHNCIDRLLVVDLLRENELNEITEILTKWLNNQSSSRHTDVPNQNL